MQTQILHVRISDMQNSNLSHGQRWYFKDRQGLDVTKKKAIGHLTLTVCQQKC